MRKISKDLPLLPFIEHNPTSLKPHHMRVLASMPGIPKAVLREAARCPNAYPAGAVDFSCSPEVARILLDASSGEQVFTLFDQDAFSKYHRSLDDDEGPDCFRRTSVLFAVLSERVLYGGAVLPEHIVSWYNFKAVLTHKGSGTKIKRIDAYFKSRKGDGLKIGDCYDAYKRQRAKAVDEGIFDPTAYEFMTGYARYSKFFPVFMYIFLARKQQVEAQKLYDAMSKSGLSSDTIGVVMRAQENMRLLKANSPENKKQLKKLKIATSKDPSKKELYGAVKWVSTAPDTVKALILEYL